jgi:hypothetical protein
MLFSHLITKLPLGRWSVRRRALLVLGFGIINLLAVLLLWYWLMVFLPRAHGASLGEASARLSSMELLNEELNTKRLALLPQAFSADLVEHVSSRKPELSYLLDQLRDWAESNQIRLHHIRPGQIDTQGMLSIEIRAQVSLKGLAGFWAAFRQMIYDVQIQQLEMLERDEPGQYGLTLRVLVGTGAYAGAFYAMHTNALSEVMGSSVAKPSATKQPRGFIVRDDGSRVIYLRSDSEGRLHRVSAR